MDESEDPEVYIYLNGEKLSDEAELFEALDQAQERMVAEIAEVEREFGVSPNTADAIVYLRSRSRWTPQKEVELIERDRAGNPIPLGKVLSGEF